MQKPSFDRKSEYVSQLGALNRSFLNWFKEMVEKDPNISLEDGASDYLSHLAQIEERYLKVHGDVLTFGNGECGQLGQGTEEEDLRVRYPKILFSLRDKKVILIACGGLHNVVVTNGGLVYSWGCNDDGALGRGGDENFPSLVEGVNEVVEVTCGDSHSLALTSQGNVFGWGAYKSKEGEKMFTPTEQGGGDIFGQRNSPVLIHSINNIVQIRAGSGFNLARGGNGRVYSWGLGECGQLSRVVCSLDRDFRPSNEEVGRSHLTPQPMMMSQDGSIVVKGAKAIGCGAYHSIVVLISEKHEIYGSGLNNYGQIGEINFSSQTPFLTPIPALDGEGISEVDGGMHHSTAFSKKAGKVFAWGRGDSGQLGYSDQSPPPPGWSSSTPREVPFPPSAAPISLSSGSSHNLVLTQKGFVYSWGFGEELALGHGEEKDEIRPRKMNFETAGISNMKITQVIGGGQHSAILGVTTS